MLDPGFLLNGRFEIEEPLGAGGFGCVYRAHDHSRGDKCVVKELFPPGSSRNEDGLVQLPHDGRGYSTHLRQRFITEAKVASRAVSRGALPVRAAFSENGTAYLVTDFAEGCQTLEAIVQQRGPLSGEEIQNLALQLLDTLEALHRSGIIHRDIKPTNILIGPRNRAYLIDFGAAREWLSDVEASHTVMASHGYSAPEQMSPKGRRGPPTDLYALAATLHFAATGNIPAPSGERAAGLGQDEAIPELRNLPRSLEQAIRSGLELRYVDRPQTVAEFRDILNGRSVDTLPIDRLGEFDRKKVHLQRLRFAKRECPNCHGVLTNPKPLRHRQCPVCRQGFIRDQKIEPLVCPHCRQSRLKRFELRGPNIICPICAERFLFTRKRGLFKPERIAECPGCGSAFDPNPEALTVVRIRNEDLGAAEQRSLTFEQWRHESGRSSIVYCCTGCEAQLDEMPDGRWKQTIPAHTLRWNCLYPDEWARVAAGLQPNSGNAECDACGADYFVEGETLTLTHAATDPHGFGARYMGRMLTFEAVRWLGIGKESPVPGLVCEDCGIEFDSDGPYLRLVSTDSTQLIRHIGEVATLEDWHRMADELPTVSHQSEFEKEFDEAIIESFETGQIGLNERNESEIWSGQARRWILNEDGGADEGGWAKLSITRETVVYGGLIRKLKIPFAAIERVEANANRIRFTISGDEEPLLLEIEPVELTAQLDSGKRSVVLEAQRLATRLEFELESNLVTTAARESGTKPWDMS